MLGFSQITRPRVSVAVSAPGGGTAAGPPLGLWWQGIRHGHPGSPMTITSGLTELAAGPGLPPDCGS
jgi:hypothetical protein